MQKKHGAASALGLSMLASVLLADPAHPTLSQQQIPHDPTQIQKLSRRCFIWTPQWCDSHHHLADERLVREVTRHLSKRQAAEKIFSQGTHYLDDNQDPINALYRFNQALLVDNQLEPAWLGAARAYESLKALDSAELVFQTGETRVKKKWPLQLAHAHILQRQQKLTEAKKMYDAALKAGAPRDSELEQIVGAPSGR